MTTRLSILLGLTLYAVALASACTDGASDEESMRAAVVNALDDLAAELVAERPEDAAAYMEHLRAYLEDHPSFFGSAAVLLDRSGAVIASPYVYRTDDGYADKDLAGPSYNVEGQDWFTASLSANAGIWTDPYFDAGGGDVWMVTRSLPVSDDDGTFVIITTDLVVEEPGN